MHQNMSFSDKNYDSFSGKGGIPFPEFDATPVLFRFNYDAMPSLKSLNLSIVVS